MKNDKCFFSTIVRPIVEAHADLIAMYYCSFNKSRSGWTSVLGLMVCLCIANGGETAWCQGGRSEPANSFNSAEAAEFVELPDSELEPMIKTLSGAIRSNYERLKTWAGRFDVEDRQRVTSVDDLKDLVAEEPTPPILRIDSGSFTFDIDFAANKIGIDFKTKPPVLTEIGTGRELTLLKKGADNEAGKTIGRAIDHRGFLQQSILSPEDYLNFEPLNVYGDFVGSPPTGHTGRAAFRDPLTKSERQEWGIIPDPRAFYGDNLKFFAELEQLNLGLAHPVDKEFTDEKRLAFRSAIHVSKGSGNDSHLIKVAFIAKNPGSSIEAEIVRVYDADLGFNPVLAWQGRTGDGGIPGIKTTYAYQKEQGLVIPSRVVRLMTGDKKFIRFQRLVTLKESRVNEPVSDDRFTIARFGLQNGERVVDHIDNSISVIENGKLVPVTAIVPPAPAQNLQLFYKLIWLNLILVVAVVIYQTRHQLLNWVNRRRTKR